MINSFHIEGFRGIRNLSVNHLNTINLIVGDNNSGKTSVLEALQLLSNPSEISNLFRVARYRDSSFIPSGLSLYENVICMFPHAEDQLSLGVFAEFDNIPVGCYISGKQERIIVDPSEVDGRYHRRNEMAGENEADQFQGTIEYIYGMQKGSTPLQINTYSRAFGASIDRVKAIRMRYISPCDHLRGSLISQIIRNDGYKDICVKALQLFDPDIIDILVLRSTVGVRSVDYIKHKKLGIMPLTTFGDGIKKVLVIANAIVQATNGILFIDEVETAIHKKYYDDIFRFIVKSCSAFNVQVFITTHSIEAVDGLLATQDYADQTVMDDISVITIKKAMDQSYSRVLTGREVFENREAFGFEVRL